MTSKPPQSAPTQANSVSRLPLADFPRYWLGAYALVVIAPTVAMLLGAGAMLLGGVGTPSGDLFFGIGAFIGLLIGAIPGFLAMAWILPKEPSGVQSSRAGAIGAGSFFSLIVQLGAGIGIMNELHPILPKFFQPLPGDLLGVALTGGIFSSFCATLFMVYQDRKHPPSVSSGIHDAAKNGDLEKVRVLLKDNPDSVSSKGNDDWTPLHFAASKGHREVAVLLLTSNADVNATTKWSGMPLHVAARNGHNEVVELLLTSKADVNAKAIAGGTPLLWAAEHGHIKVVELLLANGSIINAKDDTGATPLRAAKKKGFKDLVDFLRQHGGQE
jgi:hypothetical protein